MKRSPIRKKNHKRRAKEFTRCYGSEERVTQIKALPCAVPGCSRQPSDNAHVCNGGMGRKADWEWVVNLCRHHHTLLDDYYGSVAAFNEAYGVNLYELAEKLAREIKP